VLESVLSGRKVSYLRQTHQCGVLGGIFGFGRRRRRIIAASSVRRFLHNPEFQCRYISHFTLGGTCTRVAMLLLVFIFFLKTILPVYGTLVIVQLMRENLLSGSNCPYSF
jgi:hypothetical protein